MTNKVKDAIDACCTTYRQVITMLVKLDAAITNKTSADEDSTRAALELTYAQNAHDMAKHELREAMKATVRG